MPHLWVASARALLVKAGKNWHGTGIVVLPPGAGGRIDNDGLRRWLSRGRVGSAEPRAEVLLRVLNLIGAPVPDDGLAALRFWGQTGERSDSWMAAADPIHLETRLHSLRVRSLRPDELPKADLRPLFDHLQETLATDSAYAFARIGHHGYSRGETQLDTAPMSSVVLHGLPPDEFVPDRDDAVTYHQLLGEVQMVLHEHNVNQQRAASGLPEINSLWFWGGGLAPAAKTHHLPLLIADDPLFTGYWNSCVGHVEGWFDTLENLGEKTSSGFVAVMPEFEPEAASLALHDCLNQLRKLLRRGAVKSLILLFRDGLSVEINRWTNLRIWRNVSPILEKSDNND